MGTECHVQVSCVAKCPSCCRCKLIRNVSWIAQKKLKTVFLLHEMAVVFWRVFNLICAPQLLTIYGIDFKQFVRVQAEL